VLGQSTDLVQAPRPLVVEPAQIHQHAVAFVDQAVQGELPGVAVTEELVDPVRPSS
jgi:hypothetical protein